MTPSRRPCVVVVGQIGRDLVLVLDELPAAGNSTTVRQRREMPGGKGLNQAVGCRQLGAEVALIGVVGDDEPGAAVLESARDDGLDIAAVVRRAGTSTALLVDIVAPPGQRRLLEHVEEPVLLTRADVRPAAELLASADVVLLQLQQPADALLAAIDVISGADVLLIADGVPPDDAVRDALLRVGAVLRADAREAAELAGGLLFGPQDTAAVAHDLIDRGARMVALAAGEEGDVVAWPGGHVLTPLLGAAPVDPTGAGDAAVAAVALALVSGEQPRTAAWWAAVATARTVAHEGGRPRLDLTDIRRCAAAAQAQEAQRRGPS